jgi:hypothetical protein
MMMTGLLWRGLAVAAALATFAGCGPGIKVAPVSGVVTLDGKPLANAHLAFQPQAAKGTVNAGTGSYAISDANGAYALRLADTDRPGAVVASHRVEINLRNEADDRDPRTRPPQKTLPVKYNRDSVLTFEVTAGGADKANFDLVSAK